MLVRRRSMDGDTTALGREPVLVTASLLAVLALLITLASLEHVVFAPGDLSPESGVDALQESEKTDVILEQYRQWTFNYNRQTFEWQARSTRILFWISILITVVGIAFSYWQFLEASRSEKAADAINEMQVRSHLVSLAFKSRSLAAFMMFVSIAYLLVYVTLVYPVDEDKARSAELVKREPNAPNAQFPVAPLDATPPEPETVTLQSESDLSSAAPVPSIP